MESIARQLGQYLLNFAVRDSHGWLTWRVSPRQPGYASYNLYDGVTGMALFLAALGKITNEAHWGEVARLVVQPLSHYLAQPMTRQRLAQRFAIGAGVGIGGLVYGLVRLSQWLDAPDLLLTARQAASMLTAEKIAADTHYDVMAGAAGAILGLLTLYEVTAEAELLQLAQVCATQLLTQRIITESGYHAWPTIQGRAVSGMAHGAAGIAYALARLAEVDGQQVWAEAVHEALVWERTTFAADVGNWYAFGSNATQPIIWTSWCHGAAGIGLARLGLGAAYFMSEVRHDIEVALATSAAYSLDSTDFVCCGNAGRLELFITASQQWQQSAWREVAMQKAEAMGQRAPGQFDLGEESAVVNPTFFKGLAGIGYQYLRLAHPEQLPSVLLWR